MRKALGCLCLAAFTTSCSGGTSVSPANAPVPAMRSDGRVLSAPGSRHVTIAEVSVPIQPFALAVDVNGAVYFGPSNAVSYGGGSLYRYFGGTFVQTNPWSDPACEPHSPRRECFESLGGVSAIDAVGVPSPVWAYNYLLSEGFGPEFTILIEGGSGGTATRRPPEYSSVGYVVSLITARNGAIWMGGVNELHFFNFCCDPEGDPAAVPYGATNGALVLANGPRKHVWGTIVTFAAPAPPAETIFEYSDTGAILHSYPLPSGTEIGGIGNGDGGIIGSLISGGPDDSLWFTDRGHNAIGRIDTTGKVTEYPVPTPDSGVLGIALAADGKLWFTETSADKVGQIDSSGRIVEFALPTENAQPMAIAANPPGGLCDPNVVWVAEFNAEKLAEVTF